MTATLEILEAEPAAWTAPTGAPVTVDAGLVWQRLESFMAHRWGARSVTYIAEGPGWWKAPLAPTTIATTECWRDGAWETATLDPTPFGGLELPGEGPYRLTGTVGSADDPPAAVAEAFIRLAEYFVALSDAAERTGFTRERDGDYEYERSPAWAGRALQNSGAADLLRRYRQVGAI